MGFTSYTVYYMALAVMGLAETAAITFSTPLFVIIFATFFLGEKVGLFRWGAVIVGLIGVLIIVKPGSGVFEPAALLAVAGRCDLRLLDCLHQETGPQNDRRFDDAVHTHRIYYLRRCLGSDL